MLLSMASKVLQRSYKATLMLESFSHIPLWIYLMKIYMFGILLVFNSNLIFLSFSSIEAAASFFFSQGAELPFSFMGAYIPYASTLERKKNILNIYEKVDSALKFQQMIICQFRTLDYESMDHGYKTPSRGKPPLPSH